MRTLRTKTREGLEIVTGFDELHIDPMASRKKRAELLSATPEWMALQEKLAELRKLKDDHFNARMLKADIAKAKRKVIEPQIAKLTTEIAGMKGAVEAAKDKAHNDGTTRFSLREGEHMITAEEIESIGAKLSGLKPGEHLLRTGDVVFHVTNMKYWKKTENHWDDRTPKFGEKLPAAWAPASELKPAEITEIETQIEASRITALTSSAKAAELKHTKDELLSEAAHRRSKLEITGDKDALTKTQSWYQSELETLEHKFK